MRIDFALRRLLADLDARRLSLLLVPERIGRDEVLAGFVGVDLARLLAVGLVQLVLRRRGLDAEQVVEGNVCAIVSDYFVA